MVNGIFQRAFPCNSVVLLCVECADLMRVTRHLEISLLGLGVASGLCNSKQLNDFIKMSASQNEGSTL